MQGKALKPSRRNEKKKEKTIINAKPNIFCHKCHSGMEATP